MKKWLTVLIALLLGACSSNVNNTYYQLPVADSKTRQLSGADLANSKPVLWVQSVSIPDYLAGNGVVYQTSDVQYVIAANNLWASPLDQQLQQTLIASLSQLLPNRIVSGTPMGERYDTLTVNVSGFHGRYDGRAVISGEWLLQHQGRLTKQTFNLVLPQKKDGYDALVRTLGRGWQQEAQNIAGRLAALN